MAKRIRKSARKFMQVAKSRTFHAYTVDLRSTFVDLRWVKNLRRLACEFELDQSRRKLSQVHASQRKWLAKRNASWTQVENLR